ncbi:MAG TPA: SH3 domain-containing protein [Anaerolineales bacterium]|nr:SH3 domain-containing protein [Anaerolineales bacterium]
MIQSPKVHWSTKVILGFLFILILLLGALWFSRENRIAWIENLFQAGLSQTETATPAADLTPSPAAQMFPDGTPIVTAIGMTSIYSGPGEDYEVIALLEPGQQAQVEGMNEDETWWAIEVPYLTSGRGWVFGERVLAENTLAVRVISNVDGSGDGNAGTSTGRAVANVNIRSGPGLNYQKVGTLEIDQETDIVGVDPEGFWYLVEIPGISDDQGWVSVDYVVAQNADDLPIVQYQPPNANLDVPEPGQDKPSLTALAVVNIRSGPDTIYEILGKLEVGQRAEVVGVSADGRWYAIKFTATDTGRAWVAADFVEALDVDNLPVLP